VTHVARFLQEVGELGDTDATTDTDSEDTNV
jgi:hypothetical protein